jgi:biotin carboxyl carrier protein
VTVEAVGLGVFRVTLDGRSVSVYVAGPPGGRWAFLNGRVYRETPRAAPSAGRPAAGPAGPQALSAPMPATVIKVLATPGATVKKGETLVVLEAMKMELPLRATADGQVAAVHCQEGQLVSPDAVLVELQ